MQDLDKLVSIELAKIIKNNLATIISLSLIGCLISLLYLILIPQRFTASATLAFNSTDYAEEVKINFPSYENGTILLTNKMRSKIEEELKAKFDKANTYNLDQISIVNMGKDSPIFRISVEGADSAELATIVNATSEAFLKTIESEANARREYGQLHNLYMRKLLEESSRAKIIDRSLIDQYINNQRLIDRRVSEPTFNGTVISSNRLKASKVLSLVLFGLISGLSLGLMIGLARQHYRRA